MKKPITKSRLKEMNLGKFSPFTEYLPKHVIITPEIYRDIGISFDELKVNYKKISHFLIWLGILNLDKSWVNGGTGIVMGEIQINGGYIICPDRWIDLNDEIHEGKAPKNILG